MAISPKDHLNELAKSSMHRLASTLKREGMLTSPLLEDAFKHVPRHLFIEQFYVRDTASQRVHWHLMERSTIHDADAWLEAVYADEPLVTAFDQFGIPISSSSAPGAMACMLEALRLRRGMRVLEIGTGTGYNAAILAHVVGDPHRVFSVEIDLQLAQRAQEKLDQVVGEGITVHTGNGLDGYPPGAPYDRIIATGSYHKVPLAWLDQLHVGGIIVMNLKGHLGSCAFLQVEKLNQPTSAHGTFLAGSDFMELQDAKTPSLKVPVLVSQYLSRPVIAKIPISRTKFDPSLLWDSRLAFALQLAFPEMYFSSIQRDSLVPCLIDVASETMLLFCPIAQDDAWIVEMKGDLRTWERLSEAYQLWVDAGRPAISEYTLGIDGTGKQYVTIPRLMTWAHPPVWVLN